MRPYDATNSANFAPPTTSGAAPKTCGRSSRYSGSFKLSPAAFATLISTLAPVKSFGTLTLTIASVALDEINSTLIFMSLALTALFLAIYVRITPYREFALIRAGNVAAAASLSGALLGFVIPLASAMRGVEIRKT